MPHSHYKPRGAGGRSTRVGRRVVLSPNSGFGEPFTLSPNVGFSVEHQGFYAKCEWGYILFCQPNTCYLYPFAAMASLEPAQPSTGSGQPLSSGALDPGEEAVGYAGQPTSSSQSQESLGFVPSPSWHFARQVAHADKQASPRESPTTTQRWSRVAGCLCR